MPEPVLCNLMNGVAHVRLNRPEKKNALDESLFRGIVETAEQIREDRTIRAVVLSGEGDSFCSGIDLSNFGDMASGELSADSDSVREAAQLLSPGGANRAQQLAWLWHELPVPVIAAVSGVAYGGGVHIALGADIRIVSPDARIAFAEVTWGLVPDMSASQALRRLVPLDVAKRLILTGEVISGTRAVELNLCTEVSDDPVATALELARTIASRSPDAVRAAKQLLNESALVSVREGLANEFNASAQLMGTKNQIEAVVAKLQRRAPQFDDPRDVD
jgi:enoyl-CoA hydratase/carnithine racemase